MTDDLDFYCICDLPEPPKWLINEVRKSIHVGTDIQFMTRPTYDPKTGEVSPELLEKFKTTDSFALNGNTHRRATYRRYNLSDRVSDWVRENIGEFSQVGSQLMHEGQAFTPHSDGGPRRYIINYLIDAGGPDVMTQWFQQHDCELIREGPALQFPSGDGLSLIKSIVIPEKSWTCLFGKVIHSVVGIKTRRVQLSIGFSAEEFLKLKERHAIMLKYHG
jgi:hypothetical protein